jgi:organic hydroperoxide reductase OsmC/OhrA
MESTRRVEAVYNEFLHCTAKQLDGQRSVVIYAPATCGGSSSGEEFAPDELVGAGLASCTLLSIQMNVLAKERKIDLIGTRVQTTVRLACGSSQKVSGVDVEVHFPHILSTEDRSIVEEGAHSCPLTASFHPDIPIAVKFIYPES